MFLSPAAHLVVGQSMSGKTQYIIKLLNDSANLFKTPPCTIFYAYEVYQPSFKEITHPKHEFLQGLPSEADIRSWSDIQGHKLLVLDDLMLPASNSEDIFKLLTIHSHHYNISCIFLKQVLFDKGKFARALSLQTSYFHLMNNSRDSSNIQYLMRQIFPNKWKEAVEAYEHATRVRFRPLVIDIHPHSNRAFQLRTDIFNAHPIIYSI